MAPSGYDAPFILAAKKGWYADEGLHVNFGAGSGSSTTVQVVASGEDTFGWADFGTMTKLNSQGADVKALAVIGQESPLAIVSLPDSHIEGPKDLEGKTVGLNPQGATAQIFDAVAAKHNLDMSKIKTISAKDTTHAHLLVEGRTDAFLGWATFEVPAVKALGAQPRTTFFSDLGINVMNVALITSTKFLEDNKKASCGFVRASLKGYEYASDHPGAAIKALTAKYPNVDPEVAEGQLEQQLKLLHTPRTEEKPIGWTAKQDVSATIDILTQHTGLKNAKDPAAYYTNECIRAS